MGYVLLDMDGVLVDFIGGVCSLFGWEADPWPIPGEYSLEKCFGVDTADMWDTINDCDGFWKNLPTLPGYHDVVGVCRANASRVIIASSPSANPECLKGKAEWLRRHEPVFWYERDWMLGPKKELLARPDATLVDDSDFNVSAFRAAGGNAILWPQPWNSAGEMPLSLKLKRLETLLWDAET